MANDVESELDELYALPPEDFTASRDAKAKQLKASGASREDVTAVKGARRPTVAAWLLNLLVRERPDEVRPFVELGEGLRAAQESLQGNELRALGRQRQHLIAALVRETRAIAREHDRKVSDAVVRELEETLDAALADPAAAEALLSGRLVSGLEHVGFGATSATTPTRTASAPAARPASARASGKQRQPDQEAEREQERRAQRRAELQRQLETARQREAEAETAAREARTAFGNGVEETRSRSDEVARLERELETAREHVAEAQRHEDALRKAADKAHSAAEAATTARERAEAALRDLDS